MYTLIHVKVNAIRIFTQHPFTCEKILKCVFEITTKNALIIILSLLVGQNVQR